jgi:hypothetical protein
LPKRNFGFEKRQKEEARRKKKDEKLQRKRDARGQADQADGIASEPTVTEPTLPDETPKASQ